MPEAIQPPNESERLAALHSLKILDTPPEERFDRITRTAQRLFGVESALVSLVDRDRQWFKSAIGMEDRETPRSISFCAHAILGDDILVIPDATADERVAGNANVTGPPHIRFYAGKPLRGPGGHRVGTLCLLDSRPRDLSADERLALVDLATLAERELLTGGLEELKLDFMRSASHQLRTPLTSIKGYVELILGEGTELTSETRGFLEVVGRNADRLEMLIEELLEQARRW